jgi:hypothetical protein
VRPDAERPVVTVVDPRVPATPFRVEASKPSLHPRERLLAGVLVLLLFAAGLATHGLRADARAERLLAASAVRAELITGRVVRSSETGTVQGTALGSVRLTSAGGSPLHLLGVRADGGWDAASMPGSVLQPGGEVLVGLEQPISCAHRPPPPSHLTLTLELAGTARRTLVVDIAGDVYGEQQQAAVLCGDLDAVDALILTASSSLQRHGFTEVELALANRSTTDLTVVAAAYPGFEVHAAEPLPRVLPGRSPGPSDDTGLSELAVRLRFRLADCGLARAALDLAGNRRPLDLLEIRVDGRGGAGGAQVDVRGLLAYLEGDWQAACG